ncbi:MAG: hypothetical protein IJD78_01725 [Clostridia bacterium]|nr:hypothetical protein [Clostridia bacterium]MBQ3006258.1 hypothetical protein [Clostridia bacterium]
MMKKITAILLTSAAVLCFCSCGVRNDKPDDKNISVSITAKSTAVHNHFKDRIPEFGFKNRTVEKYEDGIGYSLSVKCSKGEYKSYLKKLKKSGFEINPVEADTYYSAADDKGYYAEVTYVGEMLSVYIGVA